jgi:hypothetical protein
MLQVIKIYSYQTPDDGSNCAGRLQQIDQHQSPSALVVRPGDGKR